MEVLTAKEIAKALNTTVDMNADIKSIIIDSRIAKKGSLYVAIKGERFDGHDFIDMAVENGASAVVSHKDVECSVPLIKVDDTSKAFLELAGYYRDKFNIPIVSLTGSVGKTTTKEMIYEVMSTKFKTLKTQGNLNNEIGLPKTIYNLDNSYEAAVIEMGMNHKGEIHRLAKATKPTFAVITNIGVSHIENLGSRENILKAKLEILDGMKKGSTLIVNGDNDLLSNLKLENFNVIKFGIENNCEIKAININQLDNETEFDVEYNNKKCSVRIPTVGIHNVYNALSAIAVGIQLDISVEDCAKALQNYVPAGMRQRVKNVGKVTVIEDCYNASPDSVKASLKALDDLANGKRKIAVLGDMLELGDYSKTAHEMSGHEAVKNGVDILLTYGELSKHTYNIAKENGIKECKSFLEKDKLISYLIDIVQDDDTILFKASRGMALEEIINALYKSVKE